MRVFQNSPSTQYTQLNTDNAVINWAGLIVGATDVQISHSRQASPRRMFGNGVAIDRKSVV